jgi:serine phosphatase RsbU (regulator of sigma subunit)
MTKQLKFISGLILFVVMLMYWGGATWLSVAELWRTSDCGLETKLQENRVIISGINLEDYSPVLHPGDEILGIRGMGADSAKTLLDGTVAGKAGSETYLIVKCEGKIYEVPITSQPLPLSRWVRELAGTMMPWTFLLTGLIVFLLRHDEPQAWLLSVLLGLFIGLFNVGYDPQTTPAWILMMDRLAHIVGIVFVPLFAAFFFVFPERDEWLDRWPKFLLWLFVPFLLFILPFNTLGRLQPYSNPVFNLFPEWFLRATNWILPMTALGYLIVGLMALIRRYRLADKNARRKLQWIVAGCSLGILNIVIVIVLEIFGGGRRWKEAYAWLQLLTNFTLPLIPIAFAYAIIKHQVIPFSLIIRRGMRYVLVSRGSVLLEIAFFSVILSVFLSLFFQWLFAVFRPKTLDTLGMTIGVVSATVGIIAWNITRRLHQKFLAPIIDRRFFRQSYDSHQIISGLAESLRSTTEQHKLLEEVATKLQSALQTESVAILLKDHASGDYITSYYCEYNPRDGCAVLCEHDARLSSASQVVEFLRHSNQCREVADIPLPESEASTLKQLKAELLLPLSGKEQMLGIITLGHRLGDLPFAREDEELLMSVANPVALAIENSRLVEQMIEDARRREELETENEARAKELEGARQLQLSMLPKKIPQLPNLEIAAYMKTATEVGGDYYDFHLNSDDTLTIAVGDATGHGLKAGTVVTAIKSLFRTFASGPELVPILTQSSRVLKEMNLRSLFMAMIVVRIAGYNLKVSAAGMPPMLIYRALTGAIEEIFIKALPLGSVLNYPWRQEEVTIDPGDVIVLMSDGWPERFNAENEMFGYEKAHAVLIGAAQLSPSAIIEQFVQIGDQWAAGHPQDDDVTFVVLKVK